MAEAWGEGKECFDSSLLSLTRRREGTVPQSEGMWDTRELFMKNRDA